MKLIFSKFKIVSIKILKKLRIPLVIMVVSFAIIFSLFRALTPWVAKYKSEFEKQASLKLGQPVKIQNLETSWYWFRPVLKLNDVKILDDRNKTLHLNKLLVGIDLWSSLWNWQIKPGILYISDVSLVVKEKDDRWEVDGLKHDKQTMQVGADNAYLPVLGWLLSQERIIVKHFCAEIYFANGDTISLQDFNFKAVNSYGTYKIYGDAKLKQKNPTSVSILAQLQINPDALSKVSGNIYLSLQNFLPDQWYRFLPKFSYRVKNGLCNIDAWVDIKDGVLANLQTIVDFKGLELLEIKTAKQHKAKFIKANIAWRKLKSGWQIIADKINISLDGVNWPQNKISVEYSSETNDYSVFIQKILVEPLFSTDVHWPEILQSVVKLHPKGELYDTQIRIRDGEVNYFLTRFMNIGWFGKNNLPAVKQISGVLYWEPTEGRLALDGEKTTIAIAKYEPLSFDVFNADIYWKALNNGFRVNLDRFILSNENLVLSSTGVLDNFKTANSNIRLEAEFSAKNAQNLLQYIPSGHLKPKFEEWLKKDVKQIGHASGKMILKGKLEDFPYDNNKGKFVVMSHVSGVDLAINSSWPLNRDIDADLEFNKRSFTANVDQANLEGLLINKLNLVVDNIGSGTESLLIHGEIEAPGLQMKNYIYATPLKDRLARWKNIDIDDQFWVDLNLDIPLYPENNHVVASGEMVFSENPVIFNLSETKVRVTDVSGSLKFNEYGLTNGKLRGGLDGFPITLQARSIITPTDRTEINIAGEASLDYLQKIIKSPILNLLYGNLKLEGLWTIYPDINISDNLHLATNLQGVGSSLPTPFKKVAEDMAPLFADIEFGAENKIDMHVNYNQILDGRFLFSYLDNNFKFDKGELLLDKKLANLPKGSGLKLSGFIDKLDVANWQVELAKLPKEKNSSSIVDTLSNVDLQIGSLVLYGRSYDNLILKAQKNTKNDWSIAMNQDSFSASDLHYNVVNNTFKGVIDNLYLDIPFESESRHLQWQLQPTDIPNMDISIKDFKINKIDIGKIAFKSTSSTQNWTLNSLDIKSSDYNLRAEAQWKAAANNQRTDIKANLRIDDLAKSLERLNITPVVHSKHGRVIFDGGWDGAIYDFSLKDLVGDMFVTLKSGRISNFDKEVEEKLGLGKLLSILSLQTIPRRLKLDFSDLSQNGYSFDIFKGNFLFSKGIMSTTDSYIDGPVAYAKMTGNLDLSKHLYDINLRITPYITASLPVVATIAGGPIAGFATWVASSIINKGMQNITGYTYKISGPWLNPVVQQVKIYRKSR